MIILNNNLLHLTALLIAVSMTCLYRYRLWYYIGTVISYSFTNLFIVLEYLFLFYRFL